MFVAAGCGNVLIRIIIYFFAFSRNFLLAYLPTLWLFWWWWWGRFEIHSWAPHHQLQVMLPLAACIRRTGGVICVIPPPGDGRTTSGHKLKSSVCVQIKHTNKLGSVMTGNPVPRVLMIGG